MLKCKYCKKEVWATINESCHNCYYAWEVFPLSDKIGMIILILIPISILVLLAIMVISQ
jgi:hypothetical protein